MEYCDRCSWNPSKNHTKVYLSPQDIHAFKLFFDNKHFQHFQRKKWNGTKKFIVQSNWKLFIHFLKRNDNSKFSAPQQCLESKNGRFLIRKKNYKIQIPTFVIHANCLCHISSNWLKRVASIWKKEMRKKITWMWIHMFVLIVVTQKSDGSTTTTKKRIL